MRAIDFAKLHVLYVHGNQFIATIIRNFLRTYYVTNLHEVADAMQAMARLRETEFNLAIIDLTIGDVDGIELAQLIRTAKDSGNPDLPIIMVSAHSERSIVESAIRAGVDEFLVTPISSKALQQRIEWVIEHPRPTVESAVFKGTDRRRRNDPNFAAEDRRVCEEI